MIVPIYIPANSAKGFSFVHFIANIFCHPSRCDVISQYDFDLHFPDN